MKHRVATVMSVDLVPVRPLECIILRIVHRATVVQMVKQIVQLFRERYTET
jgi:phage tail sheath protein FI